MSAASEDSQTWGRRPRSEVLGRRADGEGQHAEPPADPDSTTDTVLLEPHEDRWHWRRKIRQNPGQLVVYRLIVGFVGLVFIALGLATGWIPGPGGIPLVLLGLAVWSSEFEWAHRLMLWFKDQLRRYRGWSLRQKVLFWVVFLGGCGLCGYLYMLGLGVPGWLPNIAEGLLARLPGLP